MDILIDEFKYLTGAYYGMKELDEYDLKEYILKDIENYIKDFVKTNKLGIDYKKETEEIEEKREAITKFQDLLLILPKIDAPIELTQLVKQKIKKLKEENQ